MPDPLLPQDIPRRPALRLVETERSDRRTGALADVSPRLLQCFVAVAEELHFGRAADRLYVGQPALSHSIRQLERLLDQQLFVRTTRSVEPTPSAGLLLPAARQVLESLAELAGELNGAQQTLRVAHIPSSDTTAIVLDHLWHSQPSLHVQERVMSGMEQLAGVRDGVLDVAVCRAAVSARDELRAHLVRLDPLMVAVIGREPGRDRPVDVRHRTVAAADAAQEPDYADFLTAYERRAGCSLRRVDLAAGSGTEAYAMRRAGARAFLTLASGGVRLDAPCPTFGAAPVQAYFPWSVVWRRGSRSPAVRAFLAAADAAAVAHGWRDVSRLPGEPWVPSDDFANDQTPWTPAV